jgi:hypothetical protein
MWDWIWYLLYINILLTPSPVNIIAIGLLIIIGVEYLVLLLDTVKESYQ